jgi:hypothetical protein
VTLTLENIVVNYAYYAQLNHVPSLQDHGVPEHDVLARITGPEFTQFYKHAASAAKIAREALDAETVSTSANKWRELFGDKFPASPEDSEDEGKNAKGPFITAGVMSRTGDLTPRKYGR